jgi:hypothetical protein
MNTDIGLSADISNTRPHHITPLRCHVFVHHFAPKCCYGVDMSKKPVPDPSTRKSVSLPDDIWEEITAWRLARRISAEAEAIRQLILAGLAAEKRKAAKS